MSKLSPSTVAINTIAHNLANALNAVSELDRTISEDLRSLLHLASCEVDRVRKANRKAAAAAKRASGKPVKSEKKTSAKRAKKDETPVAAKPRGRSKAVVNGVLTTTH
jgi:hypothetical protein